MEKPIKKEVKIKKLSFSQYVKKANLGNLSNADKMKRYKKYNK